MLIQVINKPDIGNEEDQTMGIIPKVIMFLFFPLRVCIYSGCDRRSIFKWNTTGLNLVFFLLD